MVGRRCNGSGREEREGEGRLVICRFRFRLSPLQGVARRAGIRVGRETGRLRSESGPTRRCGCSRGGKGRLELGTGNIVGRTGVQLELQLIMNGLSVAHTELAQTKLHTNLTITGAVGR